MSTRERSFRVETVVLRHNDWGEADRMLVLFTLEMGKVRAIAKGARKLRSRKAGHLEPFTRATLQLAHGRDMLIVTQADTVEAYPALRDDLMLVTYAAYVVELLDRFTYEEGENRALYRLLTDTLKRLNASPDSSLNPEMILRYYEIRLLDLMGFRPQLFECTHCGNEIQPQNQYFSAHLGGVLCPNCGPHIEGSRPVSMNALRYMRHFQRSEWAEAARANLAPEISREMENLIQHYITYLLERGLNTPPFVRRVRKGSQVEETEG